MAEKLLELSRKQPQELERLYKQEPDPLVAQRLQASLLLDSGNSAKEVARILLVSRKTIKRWIKIYLQLGLDLLRRLKHNETGIEARFSSQQLQQLEQHLDLSNIWTRKSTRAPKR